MKLDLQIQGLDRVEATMKKLAGRQIREAAAKAVNDVAYLHAGALKKEMRAVFDRPTPYIIKSILVKEATADKIEATVAPTYPGGKGVEPQQVLAPHDAGGGRPLKRYEKALRNAGILPPGKYTAMPTRIAPFPGSHDGRGNFKASFIVQLLSYFKAFGEQGYRANMTDARRDKLANRMGYRTEWYGNHKTNRGYTSAFGVEFFYINRHGQMKGVHDRIADRYAHLHEGIWAKSGQHGATGVYRIWPVMLFIAEPSYRSRITTAKIVEQIKAQEYFERRMRYRIRQAAGV